MSYITHWEAFRMDKSLGAIYIYPIAYPKLQNLVTIVLLNHALIQLNQSNVLLRSNRIPFQPIQFASMGTAYIVIHRISTSMDLSR